jgi:hypothetical protein
MTKKLLVQATMAALLAVPLSTARADLVLTSLQINPGNGFGNAQTIFTLQVTGGNKAPTDPSAQNEQGCYAFGNQIGAFSSVDASFAGTTVNGGNFCTEGGTPNQVASGSPKNALPSLSDAGITNTGEIGLLLNMNQVNTAGLTVNDMVLSFYTPGGDVIYSATLPNAWCTTAASGLSAATIASLCSGTDTFLKSEVGQGSAGTVFLLTAAQQTALQTAITNSGFAFGSILVGASADFGCIGTQTANCKEANDGAESLQLARVNATSLAPEPASAALMATGFLGLVGIARRRRNK